MGVGGDRGEVGEIVEADPPRIRSFNGGVELGIGKTSAEGERVFAMIPNGVDGRHPAVLEYAGESALRSRSRADVQACVEGAAGGGGGATRVILGGESSPIGKNLKVRKKIRARDIQSCVFATDVRGQP